MAAVDASNKPPATKSPIEQAISAFAHLPVGAGQVLRMWKERTDAESKLQSFDGHLDEYRMLPDEINSYSVLAQFKQSRREYGQQHGWSYRTRKYFDALDDLTYAVRRWYEQVEACRSVLPGAALWMDDQREPPLNRWTASVRGELNAFGGLINPITVGDLPGELDVESFQRSTELVCQRLSELKRVRDMSPASTPEPTVPAQAQLTPIYGDDPDFRPSNAFPKELRGRLRASKLASRVNKKVRVEPRQGMNFYSYTDARCLWPEAFERSGNTR